MSSGVVAYEIVRCMYVLEVYCFFFPLHEAEKVTIATTARTIAVIVTTIPIAKVTIETATRTIITTTMTR